MPLTAPGVWPEDGDVEIIQLWAPQQVRAVAWVRMMLPAQAGAAGVQ